MPRSKRTHGSALRGSNFDVESIVKEYEAKRPQVELTLKALVSDIAGSSLLSHAVHTVRHRVKDVDHLRAKLERKAREHAERGEPFDLQPEDLFDRVTDLAGCRLIHIHSRQIVEIDRGLRDVFDEAHWDLVQGPIAKTWDDEMRSFYASVEIETEPSDALYTSVHYVVRTSRRTPVTCEIQVRTLMEEVWAEVSHVVDYPRPTDSLACREQLSALARISSGASRLVDSIFVSKAEFDTMRSAVRTTGPRAARPTRR